MSKNHDQKNQEEETQKHQVRSALIWGQSGRVLEVLANIAFSILVIRLLDPSEYGLYAIVWSVVNTSILLVSFGYEESIAKYTQLLKAHQNHVLVTFNHWFVKQRLFIGLITAAILITGAPLISRWTQSEEIIDFRWVLGGLTLINAIWNLYSAILASNLRMKEYVFIRLTNQLLNLGLSIFGFIFLERTGNIVIAAMTLSFVISLMILLATEWRGGNSAFVSKEQFNRKKIRTYGLSLWGINLATYGLASQIDVLLIAVLLTNRNEVSFYQVPVVLMLKVMIVLTGWQAILLPASSKVYKLHGRAGLKNQFLLYMKINLFILLPVFIFFLFWARPIFILLFGTQYQPGVPNFILLLLFSITSTILGAHISQQLLFILDRQNAVLSLRITGGLINFILDVLLIPIFGVLGAILATGLSNLFTHSSELILIFREKSASIPIFFTIKIIATAIIAVIPTLIYLDENWFNLLSGTMIFGLLFFVLTSIFKLFQKEEISLIVETFPILERLFFLHKYSNK